MRRYLRCFPNDARGATAIEFGILALPFFLTVFVLLQTAVIYVADMTMSFEAQRISRVMRTGQAFQSNLTADQIRSRICDKMLNLIDCSQIAIDLKRYNRFSDIPKTLPIVGGALDRQSFGFDNATASTIMALRIYYELPVVGITEPVLSNLSNGRYLVSSVNVFKTEPF